MSITISRNKLSMNTGVDWYQGPGAVQSETAAISGMSTLTYGITGGLNYTAAYQATSIPYGLQGPLSLSSSTPAAPGGLTFTGSADDGYWTINLGFNISFAGTLYSTIYVGTNSYVTFGGGSTAYSALSDSNPAFNKIMISSGDRSGLRLWYGSENSGSTYRIRFEGHTGASGGDINNPSMVWEMIFYNATGPNANIDVIIGTNGNASGWPAGSSATGAGAMSAASSYVTFSSVAGTATRLTWKMTENSGGLIQTPRAIRFECARTLSTAGATESLAVVGGTGTNMTWYTSRAQVNSSTNFARDSTGQTSIIFNNTTADTALRRITTDIYLVGISGSTYYYFFQTLMSTTTGGSMIIQGNSSTTGTITKLTHSISAGTFNNYYSRLYIQGS